MAQFSVHLKVTEVLQESVICCGEEYKVCMVEIAQMFLISYIRDSGDIKEGVYLASDTCNLTNRWKKEERGLLALRIIEYELLAENEYKQMDNLDIISEGRIWVSPKSELKMIAKGKKKFIAATFSAVNEFNLIFYVMLAAFNDQAEQVKALKNKTLVRLQARVKPVRGRDSFELNCTSIEVLEEKEK